MSQISARAATARENARQTDGKFGSYELTDAGTEADLDMSWLDEVVEEGSCPACGQPIQYCQGHGEMGDPEGAAVLEAHDDGDHSRCHRDGCDEAGQAENPTARDITDFGLDVEERGERTADILRREMLAEGIDEEIVGHAIGMVDFRDLGKERTSTDGERRARVLDATTAENLVAEARMWEKQKAQGRGVYRFAAKEHTEVPLDDLRSALILNLHNHRDVETVISGYTRDERMRRLSNGTIDYVVQPLEINDIMSSLERMGRHRSTNNAVTDKIAEGSRSPWGKAQFVEHPAPGVAAVSCAQHGGIKLSAARQKDIPEPLRRDGAWYEEDCEANIVYMTHPEAAPQAWIKNMGGLQGVREDATARVKDYFHEQYEAATGEVIPQGESRGKDEKSWHEAHKDDFVAVSAISSDEHPGMVEVTVTKGGQRGADAQRRKILVPKDDYNDKANKQALGKFHGWFVEDPAKGYRDITPEAMANPPVWVKPTGYTGMGQGKTPAARNSILKDMNKRYRSEDGSIYSVKDKLDAGALDAKSAYFDQNTGRTEYALVESTGEISGHSYKVSKATYDAFEAPEQRSAKELARQKMIRASVAYEKAATEAKIDFRSDAKRAAWKKTQAAAEQARTEYEALSQD